MTLFDSLVVMFHINYVILYFRFRSMPLAGVFTARFYAERDYTYEYIREGNL